MCRQRRWGALGNSSGQPHRIPPENSLSNMRVIDAMFASIKSGQPVKLE